MTSQQDRPLADDPSLPDDALSRKEAQDVRRRQASSHMVVREAVRLQGEEELGRPVIALMLSDLAVGLAITISLLAELYLRMCLPDERWAELVYLLGYPVGRGSVPKQDPPQLHSYHCNATRNNERRGLDKR
jgi:hypothetical protein